MPPKKKAIFIPVSASAVQSKTRRRKPRPRGTSGGNLLSAFLKSATNPFQFAPPAMGFGLLTQPATSVLYSRNIGLTATGVKCAAVLFNPSNSVYSSGVIGTGDQSWLKVAMDSNPNSLLSGAVTAGGYLTNVSPADQASFQSVAATYRVATAAVRVTIRYAMTSAPGRLYALNLLESDGSMGALNYQSLAQLDASKPVAFDGGGVQCIQGNFRQSDLLTFDFSSSATGYGAADITDRTCIIAIGWPADFTLDVECIAHVEYHSGDLPGGNDADIGSGSLALTTTLESLGASLKNVPSRLDNRAIQSCESMQLRNALARSTGNRKRGLAKTVRRGIPANVAEASAAAAISSGSGSYGSYIDLATGVLGLAAAIRN